MSSESALIELLEYVKDPEIPSVSIVDLGIVRSVSKSGNLVTVVITPTYSGCPAMHTIECDIREELARHGYDVDIRMQYSPAWTTDWMSEKGKIAMKESGIAPPCRAADTTLVKFPWEKSRNEVITCPRCDSKETVQKSEFGSTACKALYYCNACHQPFDYFKAF